MKTFELYGDIYPEDSKYARLMAQFMMTPNYDKDSQKEWELYRDFAIKKRMSDKDMKAFMIAKDSSQHNMILGRSPRDVRDMEQVYTRQFGKFASSRVAEDECSGMTNTMDYVKCRATKMEKEQGTSADKAFPTAWSIACKYKRDQLSDADEHCQKKPNEYFKSKKANGEPMKKKAARVPQILIETIMPALYRWRVNTLSRDLRSDLKELAIGDTMEELVVSDHYDELFALKDNSEAMTWIGVDSKTYKKALMQTLIAARQMKLGSSELELMAGHTPESFKKMMKDNPELAEEWEKQIKENEGVVEKKSSEADVVANLVEKWAGCEKLPNEKMQQMCEDKKEESKKKEDKEDEGEKEDKKAHDKTARLMKRQIKLLEKFLQGRPSIPLSFEALPPKIQDSLKRIKYQETLEMDVERWMSDYRMEQQINQNRWAKETPMNKEAKTALRTLTASWGLTADETYEMLAEEELAEYLAEMEAEMWAEDMEAGGNSSFDVYKQQGKPGWFKPNTTNEDRGGNGAGADGNKNYLYHEYGSANSTADDYNARYYQKRKNKEDIKRKTCPQFGGKKGPCDTPAKNN